MPKAPSQRGLSSAARLVEFRQEPLPSCRFASSHLPQGDGFSGGDKVSGSAIRRPLGGAGCERSEQTEGVLPAAPEGVLLQQNPCKNDKKKLYFNAAMWINRGFQKNAKFFENMC